MFVRGVCAKRGLDGFELVRTAPISAAEFDDGFDLVETDAMRADGDSHVEKMKDCASGDGKLEVERMMGAKILKLGHPREETQKVISREKDIDDTFWIGLRVATIINGGANHTKLSKYEMNKFIT